MSATVASTPAAAPAPRQRGETVRLLARNRLAVAALVVLLIFVIVAVFGKELAPYGYNDVDVANRLQGPSAHHWFGTDELGRDVFSRVLLGAGVLCGLVAGFYRGLIDDAIMRVMDVLFAFPAILMAIAVLAILGPGSTNAMVAIGIVYIPIFARVTRAAVLP